MQAGKSLLGISGEGPDERRHPRRNLVFGSNVYFAPISVAFDGQQNFWAVFSGINNNLPAPALELTRGEIAALKGGNLSNPKVIISHQGNSTVPFVNPESIGFDAAGDLWVIDGGQQIVELLASQIKKSGGPTPKITITSSTPVPRSYVSMRPTIYGWRSSNCRSTRPTRFNCGDSRLAIARQADRRIRG